MIAWGGGGAWSPLSNRPTLEVCIWMHLVNGTGNSPVSGTADPGVVKQDKSSGGSVDTTKTRSDPQRVRMSSGERPIGAAKGKQSDTEALCQTPSGGDSKGRLSCLHIFHAYFKSLVAHITWQNCFAPCWSHEFIAACSLPSRPRLLPLQSQC